MQNEYSDFQINMTIQTLVDEQRKEEIEMRQFDSTTSNGSCMYIDQTTAGAIKDDRYAIII